MRRNNGTSSYASHELDPFPAIRGSSENPDIRHDTSETHRSMYVVSMRFGGAESLSPTCTLLSARISILRRVHESQEDAFSLNSALTICTYSSILHDNTGPIERPFGRERVLHAGRSRRAVSHCGSYSHPPRRPSKPRFNICGRPYDT